MSVVMRKQVIKKGIKAKGAATRLIAKAIEGSEAERRLVRAVRKLALKRVMRGIEKMMLPSSSGTSSKRYYFTISFGQRGLPMVKTSTTRRESALCNWPAATYVNPNQAMGDKLGTKAPDPALTPQQVATKLRR